jgi:hypothetical protein
MGRKTLKMTRVSDGYHLNFKELGSAVDSFNDVVTEVLKQILQTGPSRATNSEDQNAATDTTTLERDLYQI